MKVTQSTIKKARSGNTFWRVQVRLDYKARLCADITRVDLKGKKILVNLGYGMKPCLKIGSKRFLSGNFLDDVAGWSHRVQTFTKEKQAKRFVKEVLTMQHLHPLVIQDAIEEYYNDRIMFDREIDSDYWT